MSHRTFAIPASFDAAFTPRRQRPTPAEHRFGFTEELEALQDKATEQALRAAHSPRRLQDSEWDNRA